MARINQKTLLSWASFGVSFVMLVIMLASGLFSFSGRMGTVEGKIESLEANMSDGFDRLNARLISIEEALREVPPVSRVPAGTSRRLTTEDVSDRRRRLLP